ncbi:MAG: nitrogenase molybdenum-iron protein alpha chain [Methanoregula sp.]|nr:nitrogenase molybdenum-iron protein alpha chain [Methanoregula sp.]
MAEIDGTIEEMLLPYPEMVKKNRKKHLIVKDEAAACCPQIEANTRTIPGIISQRGCAYAGCKGVVVGPIKDMITITHGPVGCGYYTWGTRRNKARADDTTPPEKIYSTLCFTTDMQEPDIVFGGEKKLAKMIDEVVAAFHPRAINICATCPVGLIGDDISAVGKAAQERHGISVIAYNCEGYKGVSQSAGHHIANNKIMENVIGTGSERKPGTYVINILGEYNIGGDGWELERILKEIGYTVNCVLPGDSSYLDIKTLHLADLNLVQCHRSINYIAEMMETKYGIPWLKVNFIGVESTIESLRRMARCFDDDPLEEQTEIVIARETARIFPVMEQYRKICQGKTAFLFGGGSRAHHYRHLLADLGIEVSVAGYEFAHRDDYEGREVIPTIKTDADSKNIPELHVTADPILYRDAHTRLNMSREKFEELSSRVQLGYYEGLYPHLKDGHIMVDDYNNHETEEMIRALKPDIVFTGIKDKYITHKQGVPAKQLHAYDYSGPYAGFNGAIIFARDVANALSTPAWKMVTPPWDNYDNAQGSEDNA